MKITNSIIKILFLFVALAVPLTSCLEDEGYTDLANGVGNKQLVASWAGNLGTTNNTIIELPDAERYEMELTVTLASLTAPKKDYNLSLVIDQEALTAYNAGRPVSKQLRLMEDGYYDLPSQTVTVKAGQKDATLKVVFFPREIDSQLSWMLPIKLSSSDPDVVVSSNLGTAKLALIGNKYAGKYTSTYTLERQGNAVQNLSETKTFQPIDDELLYVKYAGYAFFANPTIYFKISVNADNTVNILSANGDGTTIDVKPTAGKVSTYDPATQTFRLYYEYLGGANGDLYRKFEDVCVKQ